MDRLTEIVFGNAQIKECGNDFCKETCEKFDKEKSCGNCPIQKAIEKLTEYEDLEEQGKLLKLPCTVGTPVYYIQGNCEGVPKEMMFVDRAFFNLDMISKIGTEFFLTQEQAELALQGMKEKEEENG